MAALLGQRADATRQADERGVAAAHVAHAQLGHGQVEHRGPGRAPEAGQGHDEGQAEDGEAAGDQPAVAGRDRGGVVVVVHLVRPVGARHPVHRGERHGSTLGQALQELEEPEPSR